MRRQGVKKAAIEISPDFVRLLVGEIEGHRFSAEVRRSRMIDIAGEAAEGGFQIENKVALVVMEYVEQAAQSNAKLTGVYFSSLLGESNGMKSLCSRVSRVSGVECIQLNPDDEARYIYRGCLNSRNRPPERLLVLRAAPPLNWIIGGTRTEMVECEEVDVDISAIGNRLINSKNGMDTLKKIHVSLCDKVSMLSVEFGVPLAATGAAASIASMMNLNMDEYDVNVIHSSRVKFTKIERILTSISNENPALRSRSFSEGTPAVNIGGMCLLKSVMDVLGARRVHVVESALLAGILLEH